MFEDPDAFDMNMKFNRANFQKYVTETYTFEAPVLQDLVIHFLLMNYILQDLLNGMIK